MKKMIVFLLFCCITNVGFAEKYHHHILNDKENVLVTTKKFKSDTDLKFYKSYIQIHKLKTKLSQARLDAIEKKIDAKVIQVETENEEYYVFLDEEINEDETNHESALNKAKKENEESFEKRIMGTENFTFGSINQTPTEFENKGIPTSTTTATSFPKLRFWNNSAYFKIQFFATGTEVPKKELLRIQTMLRENIIVTKNSKSNAYPFRYLSEENFKDISIARNIVNRLKKHPDTASAFVVAYDVNNQRINP